MRLFPGMLGAVLFAGTVATSAFALKPKEIFAPVEKLFIAPLFDDNDRIEISLYGNFTDTCYRVGPTGYTVDLENHKIKIWAKAYDYSGREMRCQDALVPFLLKVSIGILPQGEYDVEVVGQNYKDILHVSKASSDEPDDFNYAPVTHTQISSLGNGIQQVTISGEFPRLLHGCMVLKEVRHIRNSNNILDVLPIAEMIDNDAFCKNVKMTFQGSFAFPSYPEPALLHVRVANGNSQTQLINTP